MSFATMHIVIAKTWGGGEQYVYDVCAEMKDKDITSYVVVDEKNIEFQNKYKEVANVLTANLYFIAGLTHAKKVAKWVEEYNIKILNCHSGHAMLLCMLVKKMTKVKLVMFKHNALPSKHDLYHRFQRKFVDAFICVSKLVYKLQTESLSDFEKRKYHLVYNGINTKRFNKYKDTIFEHNDKYIIGYAGRIASDKGIDIIIRALAILKCKYNDLYLYIAGNDDKGYIEDLHKLIDDLNVKDRIVFLGHVDDMEKFYRSIDVLIAPSIVKESFGLVLCEAIYCRVSVIATNSGAQSEIITKKYYGTLIQTLNVDSLIEAITNTYQNKVKIGIAGEKYISSKFNIEITVKKLIEIYSYLQKNDLKNF